jgi:hypothetical protein|tara:strand:- start:595 stop:765 length:171 start_codon:yes stop_codon:yes gene_type:complete
MSSSSSSAKKETFDEILNEIDVNLVKWEEFSLCLEEHFHALEMFNRKPNGKPMGHR